MSTGSWNPPIGSAKYSLEGANSLSKPEQLLDFQRTMRIPGSEQQRHPLWVETTGQLTPPGLGCQLQPLSLDSLRCSDEDQADLGPGLLCGRKRRLRDRRVFIRHSLEISDWLFFFEVQEQRNQTQKNFEGHRMPIPHPSLGCWLHCYKDTLSSSAKKKMAFQALSH